VFDYLRLKPQENAMKIATVELFWKRSVSAIVRQQITVTTPTGEMTVDVPADQATHTITVPALSFFKFKVVSIDADDRQSVSMEYSRTLGTLEDVQPATELGSRIVNVEDTPDSPSATHRRANKNQG
jgi:hypothetical protein